MGERETETDIGTETQKDRKDRQTEMGSHGASQPPTPNIPINFFSSEVKNIPLYFFALLLI